MAGRDVPKARRRGGKALANDGIYARQPTKFLEDYALTEGFDTRDLKDAKALLDELNDKLGL
jgi:hypothetical protein